MRILDRARAEVLRARRNLEEAAAGRAPRPANRRLPAMEAAPGPAGKRFVIHAARDVDRLLPRLLFPWKLPHIVVWLDTIPTLEMQRARIASRACATWRASNTAPARDFQRIAAGDTGVQLAPIMACARLSR